jgi:hypothetical protein
VPWSAARANSSVRSWPAGIDSNRLNAGSMSSGYRKEPMTTSAAAPAPAQAHQVRGARRASATSASRPRAVTPALMAVAVATSRAHSPHPRVDRP